MHISREARLFFYFMLGLTAIGTFLFLRPYLALIIFSFLLGLLFYSLHEDVLKEVGGRNWLALIITFLAIILTFLLPVVIAGALIIHVLSDFAGRLQGLSLADGLSIDWIVGKLNELLAHLPGFQFQLRTEEVTIRLQGFIQYLLSTSLSGVWGLGDTLLGIIPAIFITFYIISAVLSNYEAMSQYLHKLSPLPDTIDRLYVKRIKSMTHSMVKGTLVIAVIQGTLTGLFLWIAGIKYAAFLGLLATITSIIPLGAGVIALPIGILLIATGNVLQGLLQIAGNLLIVANIDNILRPRLVSKEVSLHPALVMIGLFAGIAHFGFLGAIYGPVLMVFFVTTLEVYIRYFQQEVEK